MLYIDEYSKLHFFFSKTQSSHSATKPCLAGWLYLHANSFFYTLAALFIIIILSSFKYHIVSAMSMHRCWTSHKLASEISVFLTFLPLVSVFAQTIIQVFFVAVDGSVRASQTISCTILEPSWFEEGLVSQLMIVTWLHNILSFFSWKHSLKHFRFLWK